MKPNKMLLIKNANLIDGRNNPAFKSDILIVGEKIAKIGNIDIEASGVEVIDGEGLYAAPGFIDSHSHSDMICAFKSVSTKPANQRECIKGRKIWQSRYYDHIIRDEAEYQKIWQYIDENPAKWEEDTYYC